MFYFHIEYIICFIILQPFFCFYSRYPKSWNIHFCSNFSIIVEMVLHNSYKNIFYQGCYLLLSIKDLTRTLKRLRVAHNLNLEELAKLTGISLHGFIRFLPTIYFVLRKIKITQKQI